MKKKLQISAGVFLAALLAAGGIIVSTPDECDEILLHVQDTLVCIGEDEYQSAKDHLLFEYEREKASEAGNPYDFDINDRDLLYAILAHEAQGLELSGEITDKELFDLIFY